jgi:hypothetical protein
MLNNKYYNIKDYNDNDNDNDNKNYSSNKESSENY